MLTPLFIFISVIFFTSRMAYNYEFVAILASGISFYRLLVPYFVASFMLASALWYVNHNVVPSANKKRLAFEYTFINNPHTSANRNIHMQTAPEEFIYMENYNPKDSLGYKFSYEIIREGNLVYKLRSDRIEWKSSTQEWRLKNYYIREFEHSQEKITRGAIMDTALNFHPSDFVRRVSIKEEMNSDELRRYISKLQLLGVDNIEFYLIELYRRTSDAFTVFILMLIGFSLATRKVRGGLGLHILLGFFLSATFIVFTRFSTTFSTNGDLPPILGVWIPNVVFGIVAVYLLFRAPK